MEGQNREELSKYLVENTHFDDGKQIMFFLQSDGGATV